MKTKSIFKFSCLLLMILIIPILLSGCGSEEMTINVDGIEISKQNLYLAEGQTAVISAQVFPFNATNQNYTFESTDESVVTIEDGFVVAKKAGDAVINVYSEEGGYKDSCNVLVTTVRDNLELNDYNNLNMPPKELEPIYNSEDYAQVSQKDGAIKRWGKELAKKASAEVSDDIQRGEEVLNQIKTELQTSIDSLSNIKDNFSNSFGFADSFSQAFKDIQDEIFESIKLTKQSILDEVDDLQAKIESGDYQVETKSMDGVTFVAIKNAEN